MIVLDCGFHWVVSVLVKALHEHLMGATGAVEMGAAIETLRTRIVPPTAHLFQPDPECDLDYVSEGPTHQN